MKRKLVSPYSSHGGRELIYFFTMDFLGFELAWDTCRPNECLYRRNNDKCRGR